jgi:23S rRNA (uridine2552-2'-O)-methyltransferase
MSSVSGGAGKGGAGKGGAGKGAGSAKGAGKPAAGAKRTPGRSGGKSTGREGSLKVHVKTAFKRTHSSTLWLERQLNDPYVAKARAEGWRARAVYKLIEIDERYKLLKPGQKIVDLGAAPGGWAQYASKQVRSVDGKGRDKGRVIAIDLLEIEPLAGVELTVMDFLEPDAPERLRAMLGSEGGDGLADGVLSDMAANATGHKKTDHIRIVHLAELAAEFAREVLAPGGFFVTKVLQGGTENDVLNLLKRDFATVRHVKPKASRADSAELYVLATGFRGSNDLR